MKKQKPSDTQMTLFEGVLASHRGDEAPFQRHSPTSRAAAKAASAWRERAIDLVLSWIRGQGESGSTDEEGQIATGVSGDAWRPARVALVKRRLVVNSARTRKTTHGCSAVVWVACEPPSDPE